MALSPYSEFSGQAGRLQVFPQMLSRDTQVSFKMVVGLERGNRTDFSCEMGAYENGNRRDWVSGEKGNNPGRNN